MSDIEPVTSNSICSVPSSAAPESGKKLTSITTTMETFDERELRDLLSNMKRGDALVTTQDKNGAIRLTICSIVSNVSHTFGREVNRGFTVLFAPVFLIEGMANSNKMTKTEHNNWLKRMGAMAQGAGQNTLNACAQLPKLPGAVAKASHDVPKTIKQLLSNPQYAFEKHRQFRKQAADETGAAARRGQAKIVANTAEVAANAQARLLLQKDSMAFSTNFVEASTPLGRTLSNKLDLVQGSAYSSVDSNRPTYGEMKIDIMKSVGAFGTEAKQIAQNVAKGDLGALALPDESLRKQVATKGVESLNLEEAAQQYLEKPSLSKKEAAQQRLEKLAIRNEAKKLAEQTKTYLVNQLTQKKTFAQMAEAFEQINAEPIDAKLKQEDKASSKLTLKQQIDRTKQAIKNERRKVGIGVGDGFETASKKSVIESLFDLCDAKHQLESEIDKLTSEIQVTDESLKSQNRELSITWNQKNNHLTKLQDEKSDLENKLAENRKEVKSLLKAGKKNGATGLLSSLKKYDKASRHLAKLEREKSKLENELKKRVNTLTEYMNKAPAYCEKKESDQNIATRNNDIGSASNQSNQMPPIFKLVSTDDELKQTANDSKIKNIMRGLDPNNPVNTPKNKVKLSKRR